MISPHFLPTVLWTVSLVQCLGIGSVLLARFAEGSRWQNPCRALFVVSLALVGITTVVTMLISPELWLISGITLSCMVVSVLFEHKDSERVSVW